MKSLLNIKASLILTIACLSSLGVVATAPAVEVTGELDWANQVSLSVPVTGRLKQLNVQVGEAVEAGQPLLQLDTRIAQGQLAQARSAVKRYALQRAEAQREWDRAKELYDRTVLSERELQVAEIGFAAADADYQAARAAQVSAEVALEDHSLIAPFAAYVLDTPTQPGQAVINNQQATPLVTLAARGKLRARAALNAAQMAALQRDSTVQVRSGDQRFDACIVQLGITPLGEERPALYAVVVEFVVPMESPLRAGQAATLILP